MNKNLLKVLTMSALLLSLGACKGGNSSSLNPSSSDDPGPQGPLELSIAEVFDLDGANFKYEGQEVTVKNTIVYAVNQNMILCGYDGAEGKHPGTTSLKAFEVEVEQQPAWKTDHSTGGLYADVTPTGTLTNVNGRPVLKNASVEINLEVLLDDDNKRLPEGSQASCGYWGNLDREDWNEYFGRARSGVFVEGTFQLASVPEAISAEQGSSFYVVFPGENTNGADEQNEYRIYVDLPAGMREKAVTFYNNLFHNADDTKNLKVGEFFTLDAFTRYDSTKGGMTLFCDDRFGPSYTVELTGDAIPEIITQWSQIQAKYDGKYLSPIPAIGCEEEGVFSYDLSDYYAYNVENVFEDASFILPNHKKAGAIAVAFNCGRAKVQTVFNALKTKIAAAGYVLDTTVQLEDADEEAIYVLKDASEEVVAELYIAQELRDVQVVFAAFRPSEEFDTFAQAVTALNTRASAKMGSALDCAVPALSDADAAKVKAATLTWAAETDLANSLQYAIDVEFNAGAFANDEAWEAFEEAQNAALVTAGFKADYVLPQLGIEGAYKASEFSMAFWELIEDADGEYVGARLNVIFTGSGFDCSATSTWTLEQAYSYIYYAAKASGFSNTGLYTGTAPFSVDVWAGGFYNYHPSTGAALGETYTGYLIECLPKCVTAQQAAIQKVASAQEGEFDYYQDFTLPSATDGNVIIIEVAATCMAAGASGYFYLDAFVGEVAASALA